MPKIHVLYIVFDLDLYKNFLGKSCRIVSPYVDSVKFFYVGPERFFEFGEYLKGMAELYQYKGYTGNVEPLFRMMFSKVEVGDWMLIQDADELPEPAFLENIRNVIEKLDREESAVGMIPIRTHEFFRKSEIHKGVIMQSEPMESRVSIDPFPTEEQFYKGERTFFTAHKLVKRTQLIQPFSAYGLHYKIQPEVKYKHTNKYVPYGINHYKLYSEWFSSYSLCGFSNPMVHGAESIDFKDPTEVKNLERFEELKKKYRILTSNQFVEQVVGQYLAPEFNEFLLGLPMVYDEWRKVPHRGYFQSFSRWAHTYGLNLVYNHDVRNLKLCQAFSDYKIQ